MASSDVCRSNDVKTGEAVVSYSGDLFKPRTRKGGKVQYGCTLLFPKSADLSKLEAAVVEAAEMKWPGKAIQMIKDGVIKSPFLDGDGAQGMNKETGVRHKGYAGHKFIRCNSGSDFPPKVVDRKVIPIVSVKDAPSGSRGFAVVNAYTWTNDEGGKGVSFGISMVQITKPATGDEVLGGEGGGGGDPSKHFEAIADEGEAPAAAKTGNGAAGLFG